jgi:hypothetical protein
MEAPTRRLDMWYAGPAPQRRLTVAFRIILLIPQIIVLFFVGIALGVVVVIGWFAALFMGRLPRWAHTFISDVLRWYTRVDAYGLLLTDRYPPFSFEDDESYPARPVLPAPGRLNRWTVLFRLILVFPAAVFVEIVQYGLTFPLLVVTWFIVLISGRMPPPLYSAYAALLRYQARVNAYVWLLTSEYAWGMLGDRLVPPPPGAGPAWPAQPFPAGPTAVGPSSPWSTGVTTPAAPGSAPTSTPTPDVADHASEPTEPADLAGPSEPPGPSGAPPGPPEPMEVGAADETVESREPSAPQWSPPVPPPAPPPPPPSPPEALAGMPRPSLWERAAQPPEGANQGGRGMLVLSGAARGWMIFAIVWGSLVLAGQVVVPGAANHGQTTAAAQANTVYSDYNATRGTILTAIRDSDRCTTVACLRASHLAAAASLSHFEDDLRGMSLPSNATGQAQLVESDVSQLANIFTRLANSPNGATYRHYVQSSNLESVLNSYPGDTQSLINALNSDS